MIFGKNVLSAKCTIFARSQNDANCLECCCAQAFNMQQSSAAFS